MSDGAAFFQAVKRHATAGDAESDADYALAQAWYNATPRHCCAPQTTWVHLHEAAMVAVAHGYDAVNARDCFMALAGRAFDLARNA